MVLLLSEAEVARLLTLDDCIAAVENAFADAARRPASLSVHVDGGAFHVKAAATGQYCAVKTNGNFFDNPARGLPRIQGTILLADAANGTPLAILGSIGITIRRTGAATAVAAKHLSREDARTLLVCGCGNQGRVSIEAIRRVRPSIERVLVFDTDFAAAERLGGEVVGDLHAAATAADLVVTCTPSRRFFFEKRDAHPGLFVAAVGADSTEKQEIDPELLAASAVVVDDLEQCAAFGDLRYAIDAGLMTRDSVRATLGEIIRGEKRVNGDEIAVFDSTGTALQDVAAAALVYERARAAGVGTEWSA